MGSAVIEPTEGSVRPLLAWAQRSGEGATVELACAEHPAPGRGPRDAVVVRLPGCLADLPAHLPLELLVLGVAEVRLRLDGCAAPARSRQQHAGAAAFTRAVQAARTPSTETSGSPGMVDLVERAPGGRRREVLDATHMPVSRRAVLLLPQTEPLHLPPEHLTPHQRLVGAARALLGPAVHPDLLAVLATIPGPGLLLRADPCVACGVCVSACPEDALALGRQPGPEAGDTPARSGISVLRFRRGRCSGCGTCLPVCDVHALTTTGQAAWADLTEDRSVVLARVRTVTCARCGAEYAAGTTAGSPEAGTPATERLCRVCAYRRAHPFGSARDPWDRRPAPTAVDPIT